MAVPYTDEETHPRVRDRPYKSIAAFPISVGESATQVVVTGVLSIDSDQPYAFSDRSVQKLSPVVSPIAQLIGLVLEIQAEKGPHGPGPG